MPGNDLISDAVAYHDDSGKLHANTGEYIYISVMSWYMHVYGSSYAVYIYMDCAVQVTVAGVTMLGKKGEAPASTRQLVTITCIATTSACGRCGEWRAAVSLFAEKAACTMCRMQRCDQLRSRWLQLAGGAGCLGSGTDSHHAARHDGRQRRGQRPCEDSKHHHWHRV